MVFVKAGKFNLSFPMPRLPSWIGTPSLRAGVSVYPRVRLDVAISPSVLGVAAGALASSTSIDWTTLIPNFASRFASLFREAAIVGARFEIRVTEVTATPSGMVLAYIDETLASAPTAAALDFAHAEIPLTGTSVDSTGSLHVVEWVPRSYSDLNWSATSGSPSSAYLKLFAGSSTGTGGTTVASLNLTGALALEFRGYA